MPITQIDAETFQYECDSVFESTQRGEARELGGLIWIGSRGDIAKIACVAEMRRVRNEEKSHKRRNIVKEWAPASNVKGPGSYDNFYAELRQGERSRLNDIYSIFRWLSCGPESVSSLGMSWS